MAAIRTSIGALAVAAALIAVAARGQADQAPPARPGPIDLERARAASAAAPTTTIERDLGAADRRVRLAAVASAPAAAQPDELLDELAVAAGGWDRTVAIAAARSARTIARALAGAGPRLTPGALVDDDRAAGAVAAWRALAARGDRWADVRVLALETAVTLAGNAVEVDLAALAVDDDPEVRRAAIELLAIPAPAAARPWLVERLMRDRIAAVRQAAGQALCAGLPADAAAVMTALGDDGREALREVASSAAPVTAALVDVARCLALDPDPIAATLVAELQARAPAAWRATLAAVIADVAARGRPR